MTHLVVLLNGARAGRLDYERGRLSFAYDRAWRERPDALPLSLSLPLNIAEHTGPAVAGFIWGLLPDNEHIIRDWARRFHVSARQPFGLIGAVGEDCAGAVQFVQPDRIEAVLNGEGDEIEWLSEADVSERLAALRLHRGAWRRDGDAGQFSLAGAQPKIALHNREDRWGIPAGRIPTTHILKPPSADFEAQAENEHFCLAMLSRLGLTVARSTVHRFGEEVAIVVERYDRLPFNDTIVRVHQEDFCQALGVMPDVKYQNQGGPSFADLIDLTRHVSASPVEDSHTLLDAAIVNWIIGGSDAHAKNFSLLLTAGGEARLAPIYDVASVLPYQPQIQFQDIKLAMKVGGEYALSKIVLRHWDRLAAECRFDREFVRERIQAIVQKIPDAAADTYRQMREEGLDNEMLVRLTNAVTGRANEIVK